MYLRYDDAIEHLRRAVEVRGADWVYPEDWRSGFGRLCRYALPNGEPGCIVGQVIVQAGRDASQLEGLFPDVAEALRVVGIDADLDAIELLQRAQNAQDWGHSWGKAVEIAISGVHG